MTSGTGLSFFLEEKEKISTIDIIESLKDPEPAAAAVPNSAAPLRQLSQPTPEPPSQAEAPAETPSPTEKPATAVPTLSSLAGVVSIGPVTPADPNCKLPYLDEDGILIVPVGAPARYSWWADGQTAQETIEEVKQRMRAAETGCGY